MNPIETLMSEHRLVERGLGGLEAYASALYAGGDVSRADLATLVAFFRDFADSLHHGKEEKLLFEAMTEYGFPREAGPIAVMLHEHDEGRGLVRALAAVAAATGPWSTAERNTVHRDAWAFATMLRGHIRKEDHILYPMAESNLPPQAMGDLGAACERYDAEHAAAAAAQRKSLEEVLARTGVRDAGPDDSDGFSCAGGRR